MTTLYIDRRNLLLRVDGNALVFYQADERVGTVPLAVLERVCIGGNLRLSARVLAKLGENGVGVLVLAGRKKKPVLMMPNLRQDAKRRVAQVYLSQSADFSLIVARAWVRLKMERQLALLMLLDGKPHMAQGLMGKSIQVLENVLFKVDKVGSLAVLRGLEGGTAAAYFSGLALYLPDSLRFSGRNRCPPKDAFNVVLSLGYTLLHFELVRMIYLCGLDPFIGFYHQLAFGRESLACDLIEPLRPLFDEWAVAVFAEKILRPEDFSYRESACLMGKAGRMRFYPAFEKALKQWRPMMWQLCRGLLADVGKKAQTMKLMSADDANNLFKLTDLEMVDEPCVS